MHSDRGRRWWCRRRVRHGGSSGGSTGTPPTSVPLLDAPASVQEVRPCERKVILLVILRQNYYHSRRNCRRPRVLICVPRGPCLTRSESDRTVTKAASKSQSSDKALEAQDVDSDLGIAAPAVDNMDSPVRSLTNSRSRRRRQRSLPSLPCVSPAPAPV